MPQEQVRHRVCIHCEAAVLTHMYTGRTTFVNTLCGKQVLEHLDTEDPNTAHLEEGVKISPVTVGPSSPMAHRTLPNTDLLQSSMRKAPASL